MTSLEIFAIALSLSADAFAVSVCKGMAAKKARFREAAICGAYFGFFQAAMPCIGYFFGSAAGQAADKFDHFIAFFLLAAVGANMIRESFGEGDGNADFGAKAMLPLAVATSIDALSAGVAFAFLRVKIFSAAAKIGITTFVCSLLGAKAGAKIGGKVQSAAERLGGTVLILLGAKILIEGILTSPRF